ncbi:MAG: hypothetical protein KGH75_05900 [Rhodospirillales bacterium]|nr:hypothetical protein [Rhodospirillales bacterium]
MRAILKHLNVNGAFGSFRTTFNIYTKPFQASRTTSQCCFSEPYCARFGMGKKAAQARRFYGETNRNGAALKLNKKKCVNTAVCIRFLLTAR